MSIDNDFLEMDEGGLWEFGVLFPIRNPNMERFEQFAKIEADVDVGDGLVLIKDSFKVEINDLIFIGPSSDPTRDSNANLIHYNEFESFRINQKYVYSGNRIMIGLKKVNNDSSDVTLHSYLKGDPFIIRSIAESWDYMNIYDFNDVYNNLLTMYYERYDSLDDYKSYSQSMRTSNIPISVSDVGIIQRLDNNASSLLNRIGNNNARMSSWIRIDTSEIFYTQGNDIDENIDGGPSDDIDEGVGFINKEGWDDDIYEQDAIGYADNYSRPFLRSAFYSDPNYSNLIAGADYTEDVGEIIKDTRNVFLSQVITVPEGALSAKLASYARISPNPKIGEFRYIIDDVVLEHCVGTSKEDEGYYKVDMNPHYNLSVKNNTAINFTKNILGIKSNIANGDTNTRLIVSAIWKNRPGYFINDIRILEQWNKEGYPIVLRTKMPDELPTTLFCKLRITGVNYLPGSPGNQKADVAIEFEEINV